MLFHSPCLNLSVSVASRHRAAVLTCASHTWASLLIRLRSILKEIPSTYTHLYTLVHIQTHCMHAHTQTGRLQSPQGLVFVNYSVCVGECVCASEILYECIYFGCVHVTWMCVCFVSMGIWSGVFLLNSSSLSLISLSIRSLLSDFKSSLEGNCREKARCGQWCHQAANSSTTGHCVVWCKLFIKLQSVVL